MLLDTSGLFCLLHLREPQHLTAKKIYSDAVARFTHNYILDGLVSLAHSRNIPRRGTLNFSQQLLDDSSVEIIWIDLALHQQALDLLFARSDKTYSPLRCGQFRSDARTWRNRSAHDRQPLRTRRPGSFTGSLA